MMDGEGSIFFIDGLVALPSTGYASASRQLSVFGYAKKRCHHDLLWRK
jgi:hypothetical protein